MSKHIVFYTDGSYSTKSAVGGTGVVGYTYLEAKRPRSIKVPFNNKYKFSIDGFRLIEMEVEDDSGEVTKQKTANDDIEIVNYIEKSYSLEGEGVTNIRAEVLGVLYALQYSLDVEDLSSVLLYCDNEYAVKGYNEYLKLWLDNNWLTSRGSPIAHRQLWEEMLDVQIKLKEKGVKVDVRWVKGHSDDYGNQLADLYATMGTNSAKNKQNKNPSVTPLTTVILDEVTPITALNKEVEERDIENYHKYILHTASTLDLPYTYYISLSGKEQLGLRHARVLYTVQAKPPPSYSTDLVNLFIELTGDDISYYLVHLDFFSDRLASRLVAKVGVRAMVSLTRKKGRNTLSMFHNKDTVLEHISNLTTPFLMDAVSMLVRITDTAVSYKDTEQPKIDITHLFSEEGKFFLKSSDKHIDVDIDSFQKVQLVTGVDMPSYLMMNKLFTPDTRVTLVSDNQANKNFHHITVIFHFPDGDILCSRTGNRFIKLLSDP